MIIQLLAFLLLCSPTPRKRTENEKYYVDAHSTERKLLSSLFDQASVQLSVIVPAFEESLRLPKMLKEATDYLEQYKKTHKNFQYEIIIVDDGSRDNTVKVALAFSKSMPGVDIRILALDENRGKGGAVTQVG